MTTAFDHLEAALPGVLSTPQPHHLEEPRGIAHGSSTLLARPKNTAEVARLVTLAGEHRIPLIPYSGGTGLVGGQVNDDTRPSVILSLERLNAVREVTVQDRSMVVEAGVTLAQVHDHAREADLLFPLTLASQGSARIGGLLATNAGGVNVIRYGNARNLTLGIEAVLPDGTIMEGLKSLRKDNTGYDLRHLMIGSEGTLGVITAARLSLHERPAEVVVALMAVADPAAALDLLWEMRTRFGELVSAFELIDPTGVTFLRETMPDFAVPPVGDWPWIVLVELGGGAGAALEDRFETAVEDLATSGLVQDGLIAQSQTQANTFWGMRETIPSANRLVGAIASHDISVPVSAVPSFIGEMHGEIAALGLPIRINCFGHLGDGNLHYNLFPQKGHSRDEFLAQKPQLTQMIHDKVAAFGGSFSAEHGVGRFKKADLLRYGDPGKLAAMRAIKRALDPHNIMNPGAVLDVDERGGEGSS